MKKALFLLMSLIVLVPCSSLAEGAHTYEDGVEFTIEYVTPTPAPQFDVAMLDSMSLDEMIQLRNLLNDKIQNAQIDALSADSADMGMWIVNYYVDEFERPTEEKYIRNANLIQGLFSNSATTNSELLVRFLIDTEGVNIQLYEYGRYQVKNPYSRDNMVYSISVLDPSDIKHTLTGKMYPNGERIHIDGEDAQTLLNIFNQNGLVRFVITEDDNTLNTYKFNITDTSYFSNAYLKLLE